MSCFPRSVLVKKSVHHHFIIPRLLDFTRSSILVYWISFFGLQNFRFFVFVAFQTFSIQFPIYKLPFLIRKLLSKFQFVIGKCFSPPSLPPRLLPPSSTYSHTHLSRHHTPHPPTLTQYVMSVRCSKCQSAEIRTCVSGSNFDFLSRH